MHIAQLPREVGGHNCGPWVRLYMDGEQSDKQYWCAGVICFVVAQAARDLSIALPFKRQVGVDALVADAKETGRFIDGGSVTPNLHTSKLQPGIIYVFQEKPGDWTHCGIVKAIAPETFDSFEGNTNGNGSSNGTAAMESNRSYSKKDFIFLF